MRAVVQRVREGSCEVAGAVVGSIKRGSVVLLGVASGDTREDARYLAKKTANLRMFADGKGKMNLSLREIQGEMLIVPQFTLYGDSSRGHRPSFAKAAPPEEAHRLFDDFVAFVKTEGANTQQGIFGARMLVRIENDGPVTLILET